MMWKSTVVLRKNVHQESLMGEYHYNCSWEPRCNLLLCVFSSNDPLLLGVHGFCDTLNISHNLPSNSFSINYETLACFPRVWRCLGR
jgi:hypothetical protein